MKNLMLSLFFLPALSSYAQSTFLDSSFGNNGMVITTLTSGGGGLNALIIQPDNKIVAAGGNSRAVVIRYLENGNIDNGFASGGIFRDYVPVTGFSYLSGASAIAQQSDGKIVIEGDGSGAESDFMLTIRFNSDGSLDTTFGTGGRVNTNFAFGSGDHGYGLALQPDGKMVIAGYDNGLRFGLVRLLPNGTLDNSFGDTGIVVTNTYGAPVGISVMMDGRIVMAGHIEPYYYLVALRFLPDGSPDTSFNHTGTAMTLAGDSYNLGTTMLLQPDGKIIVGGSATFGAEGENFALVRYNMDGSLDKSFGDTGIVSIDFDGNDDEVHGLTMIANGKVIATGTATIGGTTEFATVCIDSNGKVDSSFGINGRIATANSGASHAVTVQHDGKIILAGSIGAPALARYQNYTTGTPVIIRNNLVPVLFPNPSSGNLSISSISHITLVTACNLLGNKMPISVDLRHNKISIYAPANGLYFFTLSFDDRPPITQKIIIQH